MLFESKRICFDISIMLLAQKLFFSLSDSSKFKHTISVNMKKQLTLLPFLFLTLFAFAQNQKPVIAFAEKSFDFGTVQEENGPVSHEFTFTNTGSVPLIISDVKASCGCTTPSWTKEPIPPGEKGSITAEYDPRNRPGTFSKTVSVTSNTEPNLTVLHIKGMVQPKPKTPEDDFPTQIGHLRSRYRSFNMGKVTTKEPFTKSFDIYNDGPEPIIFSSNAVTPSYIQVEVTPQELLPQQKGSINVILDAKARKSLGFSSDHIRLFTNEAEDSIKEFNVMSTIEEYFPPMTQEELEKAPRLTLERKAYDFGEINEGSVVKTNFTLTNTGRSALNIRETKANCGCTVSKLSKDTLAPGESSTITVSFNSHGRRGKQHKTVTIFSNDPTAPTQQLTLTGRVNTPESGE